ncbi:MAG: LCP family protein [Oscillospiraceae bacterium]|nr:LCP family protein [Oscillospiraceae bacterium]
MSKQFNQEWNPRPIPPQEKPHFEDTPCEGWYPEETEAEEVSFSARPAASERTIRQYYAPDEKPRKKRRFLKCVLIALLALLILPVIAAAALHLFSREPMYRTAGRKDDCCTILLVGVDAASSSTDTILLLNVDRANRAISIMSIPRDTKVNSSYTPHKINGAYAANGCGEEGMEALMEYAADCVGFRPDGYILVDLDAFIGLVDLFGGVEFDVPLDMYYDDPSQDLHIAIPAGTRKLDGEEAMGLVRFRSGYENADIGRIRVQRDFIRAAIGQWAKLTNILRLPAALWKITNKSMTDLSFSELYWLAEATVVCGTDTMYSTVMPFYFNDVYVCVDLDQDYIDLINAHFNPYETPITWDDFDAAN